MIELSKLLPSKRRLVSVLGLTLDGSRLEGAVLRRTNGSLQLQQQFSASLALDPLTADPQLVGAEIRNQLDAAGIREHSCVVGVPLNWALSAHLEIPDLPEADLRSFMQIEAERGFPCDVSTLQVASSRCAISPSKSYALLAGIPSGHLSALEKVLRAAKLKPLSFSLGICSLAGTAAPGDGVLALQAGEAQVGLEIACEGGIAALRALEGAVETEASRRLVPEVVAREVRITLGQLPPELREKVKRLRIFGGGDLSQQLADEMELRLDAMGLKVERVTRFASDEFGLEFSADAPVSAAFSLAARRLAGLPSELEFLPPRMTAWQRAGAKYSSRKLRLAGATAGAAALIVLGLFGFQQWRLARLGSQWKGMAARVAELQKVEDQVRQYRPWYDDGLRGMTILRQLTEAFPEEGVVTAKTIEIRDPGVVTCTGTARDNASLLKTLDRLRATGGVSEIKVSQIRGKSPMQFTFDFHWTEGGQR